MPIFAICWNIVFFLAVWETVGKARQIGLSEIRFLTSSTKTAYFLILLVGAAIGIGMLAVVFQSISAGDVHEFCRRCFKNSFSYASNPFSYLITVAALVEVSLVGFFVVLLACNSLKFIRGNA